MFTGLIEDVGTLLSAERDAHGMKLKVKTEFDTSEIQLGDSIACDGACLTVIAKDNQTFTVELSHETVNKTTWKDATNGRLMNLERALRLGDRLGGHIVSGHVDGIGRIQKKQKIGQAVDIRINCEKDILRYIVEKGSIAIDGISLTVNSVDYEGFSITLIPHSQGKTTLIDKRVGQMVNLECDILGKYIEKLISKDGKIDRSFLAERGFLK